MANNANLQHIFNADMKKKLLVLLIAVIPTLMPNLVFAVAIDVEDGYTNVLAGFGVFCGVDC